MGTARMLIATGAAAACLLSLAPTAPRSLAQRATSVEQGWWTKSNPGAPIPGLTSKPDMPPDGLEVQGPGSDPNAIAALAFKFAESVSVKRLTLRVAADTLMAPNTAVRACAMRSDFKPAQAGPMTDAPDYDCATGVDGTWNDTASTLDFEVASLAGAGSLAVALVPKGEIDRVVFARVTVSDLTVIAPAAPDRAAVIATPVTPVPALGDRSVASEPGPAHFLPLAPHAPEGSDVPAPSSPDGAEPGGLSTGPRVLGPAPVVTTVAAVHRDEGGVALGAMVVIAIGLATWSKSRRVLATALVSQSPQEHLRGHE